MTPVDQEQWDDCLRACVASLLEIPYAATPDLPASEYEAPEFWERWTAWASARGLTFWFHYEDIPVDRDWWIATVPNDDGKDHVVVMNRARLAHDPARGSRRDSIDPSDVRYAITLDPQ